MGAKKPVSVLVLLHSGDEVLLLERAGHPGYWQSVTGSQEGDEALLTTAIREVGEETGLTLQPDDLVDHRYRNRFELFAEWRDRYPPGTRFNMEHVFSAQVARTASLTLAPSEHRSFIWLPWSIAADRVFSWSNRDAILRIVGLKYAG